MNRSVVNKGSRMRGVGNMLLFRDREMGKAVTGFESRTVTAHEVSNTIDLLVTNPRITEWPRPGTVSLRLCLCIQC